MERGSLIGGGVVVVLLGVFAGLFVALNTGGTDGEDGDAVVAPVGGEEPIVTKYEVTPGQPMPAGASSEEPVLGDDGLPVVPAPVGLGADAWAAIRERKAAEVQIKSMDVLDRFLIGRSDADADILRDTFEHLFAMSGAIREDMKSGAIPLKQGRDELARLRQDTARTVTDTVGPEGLRKLREDLRSADASVF